MATRTRTHHKSQITQSRMRTSGHTPITDHAHLHANTRCQGMVTAQAASWLVSLAWWHRRTCVAGELLGVMTTWPSCLRCVHKSARSVCTYVCVNMSGFLFKVCACVCFGAYLFPFVHTRACAACASLRVLACVFVSVCLQVHVRLSSSCALQEHRLCVCVCACVHMCT